MRKFEENTWEVGMMIKEKKELVEGKTLYLVAMSDLQMEALVEVPVSEAMVKMDSFDEHSQPNEK